MRKDAIVRFFRGWNCPQASSLRSHKFQYKQEEYMNHYPKRSNVESTFSMMKRKFGDAVRSKSDVAMVNEVLCKVLAHNLCVLNQEECELGIEAMFSKGNAEEKVLPLSA